MSDTIQRNRPLGSSSSHNLTQNINQNRAANPAGKFEVILNPQEVMKSLGGVLQEQELSFKERKKMFQEVVKKVIQNPSNPYSKLEAQIKEDMVNQISTVLADAPVKLPKLI